MKRLLPLTMSAWTVVLLFVLFLSIEGAVGAKNNTSTGIQEQERLEQSGPPWFNEAWHYRMPVIVNSNTAMPWYQVMVTLDSSNFIFSRTEPDGADIRFTHSDGTTELKYWIESWDEPAELAYVWVKVPALADGETTIYVYYGNPAVPSNSDGPSTFDSFDDDWSQFTSLGFNLIDISKPDAPSGMYSPFTWSIISGTPVVSPPGLLNLVEGTGIKSTSTYQNQAVGFRANFGSETPHELNGHEWVGFINGVSGKRTVIQDLPTDWNDLYLSNYNTAPDIDRLLQRVGGNPWHNDFHVYEVKWNTGLSIGDIDHGLSSASSTAQIPDTALPVTLYSYQDSNATLILDWVYVRQFHFPEPTATLGNEQGLVEMGIDNQDIPDPLKTGVSLTYQLTISNTSTINAPGVVVTDTLPANVELGPVNTTRGSCEPGGIILCNMDIPANSTASITIIVTPTMDGVITNTATVGSTGYEMDLSNNISVQETLVDSVPPSVNWEKPVQNYGTYYSFGGVVTLEASAVDNDQVAWVEFKYWDHNHIPPQWVSIGTDSTYPYQVAFNIDVLEPNQIYQTFVIGVDRAGNHSNPIDPPRVIYIERRMPVFLPLLIK